MTINCCKDCEKRHVGCHGVCQEYISQKAEHDAQREREYRKKSIQSGLVSQTEGAVYKANKRRRGQ